MYKVNRTVVIIKGKQPLVDWINSSDPKNPVTIEDVQNDCNVLLIPSEYSREEAIESVEQSYETIFLSEIEGWHIDEAFWPEDITLEKFRDWFDLEYHSTLIDVIEEDIEKSPL